MEYEIQYDNVVMPQYNFPVKVLRRKINSQSSHTRQSGFITLGYVKKMLIFISQNYGNEISLHAMGLDFGISVPYMCRVFKKHTGTTIVSYKNQLRCHRAASLIAAGTSITETAFIAGYHDCNYFSGVFKRIMGFSPSIVRKNGSRILKAAKAHQMSVWGLK